MWFHYKDRPWDRIHFIKELLLPVWRPSLISTIAILVLYVARVIDERVIRGIPCTFQPMLWTLSFHENWWIEASILHSIWYQFFRDTGTALFITHWGWVTHLSLQWRHNGRNNVSNHQPHHCLLNRLFRRRSKKTSKLRVIGICAVNSPVTGEFPVQMANDADISV